MVGHGISKSLRGCRMGVLGDLTVMRRLGRKERLADC